MPGSDSYAVRLHISAQAQLPICCLVHHSAVHVVDNVFFTILISFRRALARRVLLLYKLQVYMHMHA